MSGSARQLPEKKRLSTGDSVKWLLGQVFLGLLGFFYFTFAVFMAALTTQALFAFDSWAQPEISSGGMEMPVFLGFLGIYCLLLANLWMRTRLLIKKYRKEMSAEE